MLKAISTVIFTAILSAFLTLGAVGWYLWKHNPYNIKTCAISGFFNSKINLENIVSKTASSSPFDKNPLLSADQEVMLEKAGINANALPAVISSTMQACFEEKLGKERVGEIIKGDMPGPLEILKARTCL